LDEKHVNRDDWQNGIATHQVVEIDGVIWFSLRDFRAWLSACVSERPTQQMLAVRLKSLGCTMQRFDATVSHGMRRIQRRMWTLP